MKIRSSRSGAGVGSARVTVRVHIGVGDSSRSLPDGPFDLIFGFEVACYIEDKAALLAAIRERLAPGGAVVLADFTATSAAALVHVQTSSFIPTTATWAVLLAEVGLGPRAVLDVSETVANFLHVEGDPDVALEVLRAMPRS